MHRSQSSASIAVLSDEPFDAGTELRYAAATTCANWRGDRI